MKKLILISLLFFSLVLAFSQVGVDPTNQFYKHLEKWEAQGIVSNLPPLRPYPLPVIKEILNTVISSGNENQKAQAEELYNLIFEKPFYVDISGTGNIKFSDNKNEKQIIGLGGFSGDIAFNSNVSTSYSLNLAATINPDANVLPTYDTLPYSFIDSVDIGKIKAFTEMDGMISYSLDNIYAQAGISHNSFGSFYNDGIVLVPNAKHTVNFSVVINPDTWSYSHAFFVLGASQNNGNYIYPNKFMSLHSINFNPLDWLSFSYYESVVYGDRFDASYFIPMPFMIAQGISGFDDNIMMGVSLDIKPLPGLLWATNIFIDDLSLDDIVKFNFDTKIRGALQTGIKYTPLNIPAWNIINFDYTLITPYMYSHKQNITDPLDADNWVVGGADAINYQAYTNAGKSLGSQLAPNSDRIALSTNFSPVKGLDIGVRGAFIRHANVNESLTPEEALVYLNAPAGYFLTDGSINNHPHYGKSDGTETNYEYIESAKTSFMFMSQDTKMYIVQAGLDAEYTFPKTKIGTFSVGFGYTFEFIKNWGVQNNMFPGTGIINEDGIWEGTKTLEDVPLAIEAWKSKLKDVTNNIVTLSFKYRY